jgi:hypothetical protein
MKKTVWLIMLLFTLAVPLSAQEDSEAAGEVQWSQFRLLLTVEPLGYFVYAADASTDFHTHYYYFDSPLHELSLELEYRPLDWLGLELTIDLKGYAWVGMNSPYGIVNFWGVPGLNVGLGVVDHLLTPESAFDLFIAAGYEYAIYVREDNGIIVNHGIGASVRFGFIWKPVPFIGVGLQGAAHAAKHFTDNRYYSFYLFEGVLGLVAGFYF